MTISNPGILNKLNVMIY